MQLVTRAAVGSMLAAAAVVTPMAPAAASLSPRPSWHLAYKVPGSAHSGFLQAVAAGPRQAWALGWTGDWASGRWSAMVTAWNGKAWTRTKPLPRNIGFATIAASSPSNVWVFGRVRGVVPSPGRAARWNGRQWVVRPGPGFADAAVAISPASVLVDTGSRMEYWDGHAWQVSAYTPPTGQPMAAAGGQVWRLERQRVHGQYRLSVQKWAGGTKWEAVKSPHPNLSAGRASGFAAISASSKDNIWIDVWYPRQQSRDLIWHWNGRSWTHVSWGWLQPGQANQLAAVGRSSVWVGDGIAEWVRGRWQFAGECGGLIAGVPKTNTALCATAVYRSAPKDTADTTGEIWQSGSLP